MTQHHDDWRARSEKGDWRERYREQFGFPFSFASKRTLERLPQEIEDFIAAERVAVEKEALERGYATGAEREYEIQQALRNAAEQKAYERGARNQALLDADAVEKARREEAEWVLDIIRKSRTVHEKYGVNEVAETARLQTVADVLAALAPEKGKE